MLCRREDHTKHTCITSISATKPLSLLQAFLENLEIGLICKWSWHQNSSDYSAMATPPRMQLEKYANYLINGR